MKKSAAPGDLDYFEIDRLPFETDHLVFGDIGRAKTLNRLMEDVLKLSSKSRPRDRAAQMLEFDTHRMRALGAALYEVRLLDVSLRQSAITQPAIETVTFQLDAFRGCAKALANRVRQPHRQITNVSEIVDLLDEIDKRASRPEKYLREAPVSWSLRRWRADADEDLKAPEARGALLGQLEQMALELRTQIDLRRTLWCQTKRQAELEASLGRQ